MDQQQFAPITNTAVAAAYYAAMADAVIDKTTVRWIAPHVISVQINGREQTARVTSNDMDGLRVAINKCLDQHCVIEAVARVAMAEVELDGPAATPPARFTDVSVDLTEYKLHHGRMPRGNGDWFFQLGGLGGTSFRFKGAYSAASKAARTAAAKAGCTNIFLCP